MCPHYGDALAWVEAPSVSWALRPLLELHLASDWTDDARELSVFPQDGYWEAPKSVGSNGETVSV